MRIQNHPAKHIDRGLFLTLMHTVGDVLGKGSPDRDSVEWSMFGTALCARRMDKRPGDLAGIYEFSATTGQVEADLKFMGMK